MKIRTIAGKPVVKHPRQQADQINLMSEILTAVNAFLNPGKEPIDWFAPAEDAKAAVHIADGKFRKDLSAEAVLFGGTLSDRELSNLKVVSYEGNQGGIYVEGSASDVTVNTAYISLSGDGEGIGGPASGASVKYNGSLTLRGVYIDTHGRTRYATAAEEGSVLKVYDSVLWAHGIPFGEGIPEPTALMSTPPPPLQIKGNTRTHCTMSNSRSYFYNSTIICDGWAALSTECSEGYVYLEANDCKVICTKSGYAAYADPGCHDVFNRCQFDTACMVAIVAGNSDVTFNDCNSVCGSYFALSHCVAGWPEEVGDIVVKGGSIRTVKEVFRINSHNVLIDLQDVSVATESGVIVHTRINDDVAATKVNDTPYGVNVRLTDMTIEGDFIHEDSERDMWIEMQSSTVRGMIQNAVLRIDRGSKWIATADSFVHLSDDISPAQIDAMPGVTITATGAESTKYELPMGGTLIMRDREDQA